MTLKIDIDGIRAETEGLTEDLMLIFRKVMIRNHSRQRYHYCLTTSWIWLFRDMAGLEMRRSNLLKNRNDCLMNTKYNVTTEKLQLQAVLE